VNTLFDSAVALVLAAAILVVLVFSVLTSVATTLLANLTAASKVFLFASGFNSASLSSFFGSYANDCLW
jgi:hypothetical protein